MWSVRTEGKQKLLEMFEAAVVSPAAPCIATLRINRSSKTNILKLWKLGAATGDLSGTLKQTVGGQLMQRSSDNNYSKLNQSELLVKKKKRRRVFFSQVSLDDPVRSPLFCLELLCCSLDICCWNLLSNLWCCIDQWLSGGPRKKHMIYRVHEFSKWKDKKMHKRKKERDCSSSVD